MISSHREPSPARASTEPVNRWMSFFDTIQEEVQQIFDQRVKESLPLPEGFYQGELLKGKRDGFGSMFYENGDTYKGYWKDDLPHGEGTLTLTNQGGIEKKGLWNQGFLERSIEKIDRGTGILERIQKSVFGQSQSSEKPLEQGEGSSEEIHPPPCSSDFQQLSRWPDKADLVFPDGTEYFGNHLDGVPQGYGFVRFPDGATYHGDFNKGDFHGRGILIFPEGDQYIGEFTEGERHGKGELKYANGDCYRGEFSKDKATGEGRIDYSEGGFYEGAVVDGKPHGRGWMKYPDKFFYEGEWKKGKRDGFGLFFDQWGTHLGDGEWREDY